MPYGTPIEGPRGTAWIGYTEDATSHRHETANPARRADRTQDGGWRETAAIAYAVAPGVLFLAIVAISSLLHS